MCSTRKDDDLARLKAVATEWFTFVLDIGFEFQWLDLSFFGYSVKDFGDTIKKLQVEQLKSWSQFDLVKKGSIEEIQQAEMDGNYCLVLRYKQGLLSTHLAAAYNRLDVLKWLVREKGMSLESRDGLGRTVAEVALTSNARQSLRMD